MSNTFFVIMVILVVATCFISGAAIGYFVGFYAAIEQINIIVNNIFHFV
jgi:hypothetical protein